MRMRRTLWLLTLVLGLPLAAGAATEASSITVFAAASLTDAIQEVSTAFSRASGVAVRTAFAASSALARQIESGAPADVFISADTDWMDYLQDRGLVRAASRRELLGNKLVLIAPEGSPLQLKIAPGFALRQALGEEHWVTGDPDSVPVGRYAQQALQSLGVWSEVAPRLVRADNVRAALTLVERREVAFGIVYATDARIDSKVRVVDEFPDATHARIVYPIAALARGSDRALEFVRFAGSPEAGVIFRKYGFIAL